MQSNERRGGNPDDYDDATVREGSLPLPVAEPTVQTAAWRDPEVTTRTPAYVDEPRPFDPAYTPTILTRMTAPESAVPLVYVPREPEAKAPPPSATANSSSAAGAASSSEQSAEGDASSEAPVEPELDLVRTREELLERSAQGGLWGAIVRDLDLAGIDLRGRDLSETRWERVSLKGAQLDEADFSKASLRAVSFEEASLRGATLYAIDAALDADGRGCSFVAADLREVVATEAYLHGAELSLAKLDDAVFSRARLFDAAMVRVSARGADFTDARLLLCAAFDADFTGADFSRAALDGSNLSRATLQGAELDGATLAGTVLEGAKLSPDEDDA